MKKSARLFLVSKSSTQEMQSNYIVKELNKKY
jgi:hypothetical protein